MFLCGDSFDFLMAWKVFSFFMEVKRKEEKEGMASGDADSIWDGHGGGKREKSR